MRESAWTKEFDGARMFYTNLGHRPETWYDDRFVEHLLEGIRFAAGDVSWSRIVIADAANPLQLAVSDAGDVKVADFGIVGDVFEVLPALTEAIKAAVAN